MKTEPISLTESNIPAFEADPEHFHIFEFGVRFLLYDVRRVKVFDSNPIERDLLSHDGSDTLHIQSCIGRHGKHLVSLAAERLNRLARLSDDLAGYDGGFDKGTNEITALWLNITNACNLDCRYCYAREGGYENGPKHMSVETARASLDFFLSLPNSRRVGVLTFAGGEPLLNFATIRETAMYAAQEAQRYGRSLSFRILTNGTIMNPGIVDFLQASGSWIQISLDGPAEVQDCNRRAKDGSSSYDQVKETINMLRESGFDRFNIRSTMCRNGPDASSLVETLKSQGLQDLSLRPVMTERKSELRLDASQIADLGQYYLQQSKLAVEGLEGDSNELLPSDVLVYVERLRAGSKVKYYCGAGQTMIVVTPNGDIYPCPSLVSTPEFRIGSLSEGLHDVSMQRFRLNSVDNKHGCESCWARNLCGGGCAAQSFDLNNSIELPDSSECEVIKAKIQAAVYAYDRLERQRA